MRRFGVLLFVCSLACFLFPHPTLSNVALTDAWVPLGYGECTLPPIPGLEHTGPTYTGDNANPLIAEAVGSGTIGNTCNFRSGNQPHNGMSNLYKDQYLLAASQDLYNGKHVRVCEGCTNKNEYWEEDCEVENISIDDATNGNNMCGVSCGLCMLVSGPLGSAVFIINEIADYNAVQQNGLGLNLHLDNKRVGTVRSWSGVSKDIQYKRVPCPVSGGIYIYVYGWYGDNAVYLTLYNHRVGIAAIHNRGGQGGEQTWVPLVRDWTNRWHWETNTITFQTGSIFRGSTGNDYELRVISELGDEVICRNLKKQSAGNIVQCVDESGNPLQFPEPDIDIETSCNGNATSNIDYYEGGGSGTGSGGSSEASRISMPFLF